MTKLLLIFAILLVFSYNTQAAQCGDSEDSCADGQTCCELTTGGWGCCPYEEGVCCDGEDACCPSGTTCTGTGRCARQSGASFFLDVNAAARVQATKKVKTTSNCGESEESCPGDQTCCQLTTGEFGCCPYDSGVCCDGEDACCPAGTTCTGTGRCARGTNFPFAFGEPAIARVKANKPKASAQCGDSEDSCADGQTCCELTTGGWGCCPYEEGVCCDGEDACCPSGTTCTGTGRCARGRAFPFFFEEPAAARVKALKTQETQCGDSEDSCADGQTCCELTTGGWGCCPYDSGVCCDGEDACCPAGTTCTGTGRCARGTNFPFAFGEPAIARVKANN